MHFYGFSGRREREIFNILRGGGEGEWGRERR
jgi:hypothetical protein